MAKRPNCDVCEMQRASLYCEADEAYLCHECDASVHGANTLASRHKRISFKQEQEEEEEEENLEENDGVCPAHNFADSSFSLSRPSTVDFPLGGVRIGDVTYARVSSHTGSGGASLIAPRRKEDEELHQVPRFVPVAQELPSLEPFRFHALASNGRASPVRSTRFMSLLEGEATDADENHGAPDEDGAQENQELGVVPDLVSPRTVEPAAAKPGRFVRRTNEIESLQCLWSEDQVRN
ncbi:hypothetical protein SELMODRAFT_438224 [Selaginella moellendorffii]|uniref:B box-type domain-containing protein n=1 Tax=Selaginella moellendorffii TaxID=88036 RepID=D8QV51_SELML|nr:hypothetical protein SELMODRAFT_438224 [Selaginella moellendorffii]